MMILQTDRLILSTWSPADADDLLALHGDAEVMRYLDPPGRVWTREMIEQRISNWQREYAEHGFCKFRLTRKSDGAFIGRAGFSMFDEDGPELGYLLGRAHWGQGYATEVAAALSDWFFAHRPEPHFLGFTHVENAASLAVLRKIGMVATHRDVVNDMPFQFFIQKRPSQ